MKKENNGTGKTARPIADVGQSAHAIADLAKLAAEQLSDKEKLKLAALLIHLDPTGFALKSTGKALQVTDEKALKEEIHIDVPNLNIIAMKSINSLTALVPDKLSETQKKQVVGVMKQLDPYTQIESTLGMIKEHLDPSDPLAPHFERLRDIVSDPKIMEKLADPKSDENGTAEHAAATIASAGQSMQSAGRAVSGERALFFQDFSNKLAALPGLEMQNRQYRAEGDSIRRAIHDLLNLPGDAQLRALMERGAGNTGSKN